MARILILDRATGTTREVDEDILAKREGVVDNDNERVTWVEYCRVDCPHEVHGPEETDLQLAALERGDVSCFCPLHVHRSVAMQLKKWPAGLGTAIGEFT